MTPQASARRRGSSFESALVAYIRERFSLRAERLHLSGAMDQGDIAVDDVGLTYLIEAKAEKSINLSGYITEAEVERKNYCRARGVGLSGVMALAVVKRRGKGIGQAYVVTTLDEFFRRD